MTKNIRKSSETGVAAALAIVLAKVLTSHNWVPADCEAYVVIVIAGVASGIYDFIRHSNILKKK
jgi:hypothetical protein